MRWLTVWVDVVSDVVGRWVLAGAAWLVANEVDVPLRTVVAWVMRYGVLCLCPCAGEGEIV